MFWNRVVGFLPESYVHKIKATNGGVVTYGSIFSTTLTLCSLGKPYVYRYISRFCSRL